MSWQHGPGLEVPLNYTHQPWLGHNFLAAHGSLAGATEAALLLGHRRHMGHLAEQGSPLEGKWTGHSSGLLATTVCLSGQHAR